MLAKTRPAGEFLDAVRKALAGQVLIPYGAIEGSRGLGEPPRALVPTARLTEREVEILRALAAGMSTPEVAAALSISAHTVHSHVRSVLSNLGVRSKLEGVLLALRAGLVGIDAPAPEEAAVTGRRSTNRALRRNP